MKKGGLLERFTKKQDGVCATCANLIDIDSELAYGCEAHDKFILKAFPPYHTARTKGKDWKVREPGKR
ncbi:hypothetical protein CG709_08125 [Lachnotalea glycerini]|nr:hypothetical protein CG709_08125 [Lachnotalea glycerini]